MNNGFKILVLIIGLALLLLAVLSYQLYLRLQTPPNTLSAPASVFKPNPPPFLQASFQTDTGAYKLEVRNASFLHNSSRNYYGNQAPEALNILWKTDLGQGTTQVGQETKIWKGAGWTGQPLLVVENDQKYLLQTSYDHSLKKINASTGRIVWAASFEDVLKGTGSIWLNEQADSLKHFCMILQGSRTGRSLYASYAPSFKAIDYSSGQELWRLNSSRTASYSRDVDGSALILNDTAYLGLENSIFTIFNPNPLAAQLKNDMLQPEIYNNQDTLYTKKDIKLHKGNLVTEASPTLLKNRIYLPSGSGHVWGYNLNTQTLDWDYYIGSDMDGSAVVTADSCLLISIEKQHINGRGGLLKLDPSKSPKDAAIWYQPTENKAFSTWEGGVIGSAGVNVHYQPPHPDSSLPNLAAFTAIDGFLYVVDTDELSTLPASTAYDSSLVLPQPKLLFKYKTGPSISTPLIVGNKLIAATYNGIYLFEFHQLNEQLVFRLLQKVSIRCEATPVVDDGRLYVASRNGYLYCLGAIDSTQQSIQKPS